MNTTPAKEETLFVSGYEKYLSSERPFTAFMLDYLKERGLVRQRVFEKAGVSTGYGYKILYGEKKTANRDLILGLCLAGEMPLQKTQIALILSGFPILRENNRRDSNIARCIKHGVFNIQAVNSLLARAHEQLITVTSSK